jgi:uncharacterized RDD family membrane protein YckC
LESQPNWLPGSQPLIEERYSGMLRRSLAFLIDCAVVYGIWTSIRRPGIDFVREQFPETLGNYRFNVVGLFVAVITFGLYQVLSNTLGVSVGKYLMGIRVVNREGERPGAGGGLVRSVFSILVPVAVIASFLILAQSARDYERTHDDASFVLLWWFLFAPLVAGIWAVESLVAFIDENRQALHDKLADTFVVTVRMR